MVGYTPNMRRLVLTTCITTETTVEDLRFEAYICAASILPVQGLSVADFLLTSAGMGLRTSESLISCL